MISLLIVFFLMAIVISFLCSMWEAVLLSITPSFAQIKLKTNSRIGKRLKTYKEDIDIPLAAILTLNTIAHTVGAVGVGNQATQIWSKSNPFITGIIVPIGMTLAILVFSELVPKTLGANFWKELSNFTVQSLSIIVFLLYPLVWLSRKITGALRKDKTQSVFSRMDFQIMAEIAANQGVIKSIESKIISNILTFTKVCANDIMTPRVMLQAAHRNQSIRQFYETHQHNRFSRILLYENKSIDKITGYILKNEMLAELLNAGGDKPVHELERKIINIPTSYPVAELFTRLVEEKEQIALVVDEFGGVSGVVTMEDVIETLLGFEIMDEHDEVADLQTLARENWKKRATAVGLLERSTDTPPSNE